MELTEERVREIVREEMEKHEAARRAEFKVDLMNGVEETFGIHDKSEPRIPNLPLCYSPISEDLAGLQQVAAHSPASQE